MAHARSPRCDLRHVGVVAQTAAIQNQIVNVSTPCELRRLDGLELTQTLDALRRIINKSARVIALTEVLPALIAVGILFATLSSMHNGGKPIGVMELIVLMAICVMLAWPIWYGPGEIRHRHRLIAAAAERQSAEITVELSLRARLSQRASHPPH